MRFEYQQEKYRVDGKRFHPALNRMADEGWKVESIERFDDVALVTYSRPRPQKLELVACTQTDFPKHSVAMILRGYRMISMSVGDYQRSADPSSHPDETEAVLLSVWEFHHVPERKT